MSKFFKPKTCFVYHCIPVTPTGDCIRPSTGYGGIFNEERQKKYGLDQEKPPLIFASTHLTKTLAFGIQSVLQEKILNHEIIGSDKELVLACDRAHMLTRERDVTVFKLADTNFQALNERARQSISTKAVPFNQIEIAFKAKNAYDLMRGGLQILSFKESYQELNKSGVLDKLDAKRDDKSFYVFLGQLIKQGIVHWENKECNINPDPILSQKLDIPLNMKKVQKTSKVIRPAL